MAGRMLLSEGGWQRLLKAAQAVLPRRPEVRAAYLFGSAARGEPAADLDLGLVLAGPLPGPFWPDEVASDLLSAGAPLQPELDLRCLSRASPRFLREVLRDGRLLYEQSRAERIRFEVAALGAWADFRPWWLRLRRALLEEWRNG